MASLSVQDVERVQRRTVASLVLVQAVGALGITIGIATASLLARDLSGSEQLAGLAQTFQVLGTAGAAWLLARLMTRAGRRAGLVAGYLAAATGAVLAVLAGRWGSMLVLLGGMMLLGAATAANNAARYAATDLAPATTRARALSVVVWATTLGAVLGPNLTGPASSVAKALAVPEAAGPFVLGAVGLAAAGCLAALVLRPDPLLLARELEEAESPASPVTSPPVTVPTGGAWHRVVGVVRQQPALLAAVAGLAAAHATMVSVMVMTPLHMEHGEAGLELIGFVISVHVLGMFAFSPLVGAAADRWGRPAVMGAGGAVLLVALVLCALAPAGSSWQIFGGLFLLGLGWSLVTIAASTLVADLTPLAERADVQGAADMTMSLGAAGASALAGVVVGTWGYPALAGCAAVLACGVLLAAAGAARPAPARPRRHAGDR
ncbi:MFS transporter [Nocardioides campestrisoli]|uniref:MFS transporter n=1 Tax=Nocardioides campestrisoli TaxID=2736757 RepID=UPI002159D670|nr:MFS transporter [Nocardioides campestrisoli]